MSGFARLAAGMALAVSLLAQDVNVARRAAISWRSAGNLSLDRGLPSLASGPVTRVWFSADGSKLYAQGIVGRIVETEDLETWALSPAGTVPPPVAEAATVSRPERLMRISARATPDAIYAGGEQVYRSIDGGANWTDLTSFQGRSILGGPVLDLAASPREPGELAVATRDGIWRSIDGGQTWTGLNDGLANFPADRILSLANGTRGVRLASGADAMEWQPGERKAWRDVQDAEWNAELERRAAWSAKFGVAITATAVSGNQSYAGASDGRIWASSDAGVTWQPFKLQEMGAITRIAVDPADPRIALATAGARPANLDRSRPGAHVLRTMNGGGFWDDLTSSLPDVPAFGIAFERASGAIYAATASGVFTTTGDLNGLGPATSWRALSAAGAWENARTLDVRLSAGNHQLYVLAEGLGLFAAMAPHRRDSPRLVNAADYGAQNAAAPGSLLTVIGREVRAAQAGGAQAHVLASTADRSEIQVPFDVQGNSLQFSFDSGPAGSTRLQFGLPLQAVAPAIFLDAGGSPMLLDAGTGMMLDSVTPAKAGSRIQVLMSGLGRVRPEWPAGVAAPADGPPAVVAKVRGWIDRVPVEVSRAVLAPGYIGFYLVEIEIPAIVNYGPAELYIDAEGRESNRVRIVIEP